MLWKLIGGKWAVKEEIGIKSNDIFTLNDLQSLIYNFVLHPLN